jgi:Helix-turn-helix domain
VTDAEQEQSLAARVSRLEDRLARLETAAPRPDGPSGPAEPAAFWALAGLKERAADPGAVLFTGTVTLPGGEHYEWQEGQLVETLLADDWAQSATALAALAHPVRLLLLQQILSGVRTAAELGRHEQLGTTGQLYHHLRQLVAAGWLRTSLRGQYVVPAERIVPLLTLLAAARR